MKQINYRIEKVMYLAQNGQGAYFSGLTKFQDFSKDFPVDFQLFFIILKVTFKFFGIRITNLKFHLNKNWYFRQYSKVKVSLLVYFSNLER